MKLFRLGIIFSLIIITACNNAIEATNSPDQAAAPVVVSKPLRATGGLLLLYDFNKGTQDNTVYDTSGYSTAQNMFIRDTNATTWLDHGLRIDQPVEIVTGTNGSISRPTPIKLAVKASDALTWEAWVKPANVSQTGSAGYPAVIFSYSDYSSTKNLMVGQSGGKYTVHLATQLSRTDMTTRLNTVTTSLTYLAVTWSSSSAELRLYINGNLSDTWPLSGTTTASSGWTDMPIRVGHEIDSGSPLKTNTWLGEVYLVALYDRVLSDEEIINNYYAGS